MADNASATKTIVKMRFMILPPLLMIAKNP
jgi:hypothetical protein